MLSVELLNDLKDDHPDPTTNEVKFTMVENGLGRIGRWVEIKLDRVDRTTYIYWIKVGTSKCPFFPLGSHSLV